MTSRGIVECIQWIVMLTERGLLVWRDKSEDGKPKYRAYPSDKIKTTDDFERQIGQRLAGATIGYPGKTNELRFMLTDGNDNKYFLNDNSRINHKVLEDLFWLAKKSAAEDKPISPLIKAQ